MRHQLVVVVWDRGRKRISDLADWLTEAHRGLEKKSPVIFWVVMITLVPGGQPIAILKITGKTVEFFQNGGLKRLPPSLRLVVELLKRFATRKGPA